MKSNSIYQLLYRLQAVVPMIICLIALMFVHRIWGNSFYALHEDRSGALSISAIMILSGLVSFLPQRLQYKTQWILVGGAFLLDVIEIFLAVHFNLNISPLVFQLLLQTNSKEATEFIQTFIFTSKTLYIFIIYLIILSFIVLIYRMDKRYKNNLLHIWRNKWVCSLCGIVLLISFACQTRMIPYYVGLARFLASNNYQSINWIPQVTETQNGCTAYYPLFRLLYSLKTISLMKLEKNLIWETNQNITVSQKYKQSSSPIIVFYLGESYVKRHSQHYGYHLSTSPYTMEEKRAGRLFVFNNAITLKNSTGIVLRSVLSLNKSEESVCNKVPLFPVLLRKGGYKTCLLTNQFVSKNNDLWNVTGGHFLMDPRISNLLFDDCNSSIFKYDMDLALLAEQEISQNAEPLFIFFQGLGQHVVFSERCPKNQIYFDKTNYAHRTELSEKEKQLVCDYDNATRYVDKVMYQLMNVLKEKDAILIYASDHGEEVLDETHKLGRQHNLTQDVIRSEYEIPMWIWCSDSYQENHPKVVSQIRQAVNKPFTIDDMSHLIIGLSGIQSEYYDSKRDLLSPAYKAPAKRGIGFDGFRFGGYYEDLIHTSTQRSESSVTN